MEIETQSLIDNFRCPICWEIVEEPWETSCCGNLFCEKCILSYVANKCPMCRTKNFKYRKNEFAKLLLMEYDGEFPCPYGCKKKIKLNEFKEHKYNCEDATFKCSINKCVFEGKRKDALNHLITVHEDLVSVLSENYSSLKMQFNKFDLIEKLGKNLIKHNNKNEDQKMNKSNDINKNNIKYEDNNKNIENYSNNNSKK